MKTNYFRNIHTAFTQPQIIFRNINVHAIFTQPFCLKHELKLVNISNSNASRQEVGGFWNSVNTELVKSAPEGNLLIFQKLRKAKIL